jgi:hypothetical protein
MIVADPYQSKVVTINGVDYTITGLTAREQMNIMDFSTCFMGKQIEPSVMVDVVKIGLKGWKNAPVEYNKKNQILNIDRLERSEILELFTEIMIMGKVEVEEIKN